MNHDNEIFDLIHAVRPGGITAERIIEIAGGNLDRLTSQLEQMHKAGRISSYTASGMTFWRVPR